MSVLCFFHSASLKTLPYNINGKKRFKQMKYEKFRSRKSNSFHAFKGNHYSLHRKEVIEEVPNRHHNPLKFKNKI